MFFLNEKYISQTAQSGISIWYQKCNKNPVFLTQQTKEKIFCISTSIGFLLMKGNVLWNVCKWVAIFYYFCENKFFIVIRTKIISINIIKLYIYVNPLDEIETILDFLFHWYGKSVILMLCWYLFLLRLKAVTSTIHCHSMEAFTTRRLIGTSTKKKEVTAVCRN